MSKKLVRCATWYEAVHCWTDPGEANSDHPVQDSLGVFSKRKSAKLAGTEKGLKKFLTDSEYQEFMRRSGPSGCYIKNHLVIFTGRSSMVGRIVSRQLIELTVSKDARRDALLRKAERAGIPAHAIDLEAAGV